MRQSAGKGRRKRKVKKDKPIDRTDKPSRTKQIIEIISWVIFGVSLLSFFSGVALYETYLFLLIVFFARITIHIRNENKALSINQKLTLLFTLVIAFFTIMQVWMAFYEKIPRVYGPHVDCQEYLYLSPEGFENFSISLGNYGALPAWLYVDFQNTTSSLSTIGNNKYTLVLVPISYSDNKQTTSTFNFKVNNTEQLTGFTLNYLTYGDDLIDRGAAGYKMLLKIFNKITCNYERISNTTYVLKR